MLAETRQLTQGPRAACTRKRSRLPDRSAELPTKQASLQAPDAGRLWLTCCIDNLQAAGLPLPAGLYCLGHEVMSHAPGNRQTVWAVPLSSRERSPQGQPVWMQLLGCTRDPCNAAGVSI